MSESGRRTVLVTGPPVAGVGSLLEVLRHRMPGHSFVEEAETEAGITPAAVLYVVSAVAPMTESECAQADSVTARTDLVVAVVSKVDDHHDWRVVLEANRERLGGQAGRLRHLTWVGVAAAPRLGEPIVDELVELLERRLGDPQLTERNSLRAREFRLCAEIDRLCAEAAGVPRRARIGALRGLREELVRERQVSRSGNAVELRSRIQQTRLSLMYFARNRCASVRSQLLELAAGTTRRQLDDFGHCVRRRCRDIVIEVDDEVTARSREVAAELGLAEPPQPDPAPIAAIAEPAVSSRRLETQLMTVLGAGFGLGVALVVTRLFAGLAPELTAGGLVVGTVAGLAVTVWVVRVRGVLHDRAVLDRWVNEVTAAVRSAVEERVALRVLSVESALTSAHWTRAENEKAAVMGRIAEIDADIRELERAAADAEAVRDRTMPALRRDLRAVREALSKVNSTQFIVTDR